MSRKSDAIEEARLLAQMRGGAADDYLDEKHQRGANGKKKWTYAKGEARGGDVIAEYVYLDEHGEPYLRVQRTDDKQFPQSRWDGKAWQWGKPKGPKIPYMLPALIAAAPEEPVLICEGEKDAESVADLGLIATTNSEGAGKWTKELNRWFAGRKTAYVLEDDDDAGRKHAQKVAKNLREIVEEIRIVRLPGCKDVSDWIAAGGTREKLLELCAAANLDVALTISIEDFWSFAPTNEFFFVPSLAMWPSSSVDARLPPVKIGENDKGKPITISATRWLSLNRSVETMTWAPGLPQIIADRVMTADGGLKDAPGLRCFNTYRGPPVPIGDATQAGPWIELVRRLYPDNAEHIFDWGAHRVQKPGDKINHAIVMTGPPGIGKDTIITAIMRAVGTWNCSETSPEGVCEHNNPHVRAVIMRISEAHDLGDVSRYVFYERMKTTSASPPETLAVVDKYIRKYYIPNVVGVIITSNYRTDCLYLPPDDRRHYVAWSDAKLEDFAKNFFSDFWTWLNGGGDQHVAAWLTCRDISKFDAKAPPLKTPAFWDIVDAGRPAEESELKDVLDILKNPPALTVSMLRDGIPMGNPLSEWFDDRRNIKAIGYRLDACGYMRVHNDDAKDGVWKIAGRRHSVYAKKEMSRKDQLGAIAKMIKFLAKEQETRGRPGT